MKHKNPARAFSRRSFIGTAVAGGVAFSTSGTAHDSVYASKTNERPLDPLEEIVTRCGSELGDVRAVRPSSDHE